MSETCEKCGFACSCEHEALICSRDLQMHEHDDICGMYKDREYEE